MTAQRTFRVPARPTFGEFIAERFGPKWVYAHRATERLKWQYPGSVVITPKHQRQLKADYQALYGNEYPENEWTALHALRTILNAHAGPTGIRMEDLEIAYAAIALLEGRAEIDRRPVKSAA